MPQTLQRSNGIERRCYPLQMRNASTDGEPVKLTGYASVFNVETVLIPANAMWSGSPEIREIVEPGAFTKTLAENDIHAYWNHDSNYVLGRNKNNTLRLWEDKHGLGNEIMPPNTQLINDIAVSPIERGDVDQESFGFSIVREVREDLKEQNVIIFRLKEVRLYEVSPVPKGQYPETQVSARSMESMTAIIEEIRQQRQAAVQSAPGETAHPEQTEHPDSTPAVEHPAEAAPLGTRHLDASRRMSLEIEEALLVAA